MALGDAIVKGIVMSLSETQIGLVQASFARVALNRDQAARAFYMRLFEIAPDLRPMFRGDMVEHGRNLMAMLAAVVQGLRDMPSTLRVARQLAERHVGYGVRLEHYAPVGMALIETLATALGDDFTPDVRVAWADTYGALADAMVDAAYPKAA
jgi:hemoglobin-like flavoprotein